MKAISFLFAILLLFSSNNSFSQNCQWAQKISGSLLDNATKTVIDGDGNIYVSGYFYSPILEFNNGLSLTNNNPDSADSYVAKYNSNGICQWAQNISGTGSDWIYDIAIDSSGYLYVCGGFMSSKLFFNNNITLSNIGYFNGFIAKYDTSGLCLWAKRIGGHYSDCVKNVESDKIGNIYIGGNLDSDTLFLDANHALISYNIPDIFFAKYNSDGDLQWGQRISGNNTDEISDLEIDKYSNIYITGNSISPTLKFDDNISIENLGLTAGFIVKYDSVGNCQWANIIVGNLRDYAYNVGVDDTGNVFVCGSFKSDIINLNNNISINKKNADTNYDGYLLKFNSDGITQWAKVIGSNKNDIINSIAFDAVNNVYIAGTYAGDTLLFENNISLINTNNNSTQDLFISKYSNDGVFGFAEKIGGTDNESNSSGTLAIDSKNGDIYTVGSYKSFVLNFNNGISLTNSGNYDAFIAKYNPPTISVKESISSNINFTISPNPASDFFEIKYNNEENNIESFMLINELGKIALSVPKSLLDMNESLIKVNISNLPQGAYRAVLKTKNAVYSKAISIIK